MTDTISLTIQPKDFNILDHNRFSPSSRGLFESPYYGFGKNAFIKCTFNPTKKDYLEYSYLPRLTLIKALRSGGFSIFLKVEFSIPKLLYGNNFDEVEESNFGAICWKLKEVLLSMGIEIESVNTIANAEVSTIHYSKNIILTDYSTPYTYIKEISKINLNKLLDLDQTDFRNEGHSVRFHSNDYEVIFYDKLKDLQQAKISDKRTIEGDNFVQISLFDRVKLKKPFEVFRMEVRLGSRKKIRDILEKIGYKNEEITFIKLFSHSLSQKVLLLTMNKVKLGYPMVLAMGHVTNEDFVTQLLISNPKLKYKEILAITGARVLLSDLGTRRFRKVTEKFGNANWYRFEKEIRNLVLIGSKNPLDYLEDELSKFERVELEKYKDKM